MSDLSPNLDQWPLYRYHATLIRCVDGDTIEVACDLGMHITRVVHLRLRDVDTPEMYGRDAEPAGTHAKNALQSLLEGRTLYVETFKGRKSFDRYIAWVFVIDDDGTWIDVTEWLIENGWGVRV